MKVVLETRVVLIDGEEHKLDDQEYKILSELFHKFILGKWAPTVTQADVVHKLQESDGLTIHALATKLKCTDEVARRRIDELVKGGRVMRGVNPENKRQGVFSLKSKCITIAA
jgi:DNA-binding MarR family transcriptional regulator